MSISQGKSSQPKKNKKRIKRTRKNISILVARAYESTLDAALHEEVMKRRELKWAVQKFGG